ncbi:exo-beta-N-acetylmuramidase NamZ family protein [Marinoscillum luteum]|uniref:Exo-beta-N-acetylmuramidase NamZ domain-containing protein n=1 Tax=Marinoscillum luteum TaxID=861051 RepID=A0ABW7N7U8_9BACT
MVKQFLIPIFLLFFFSCETKSQENVQILPGASQLDQYLPQLKGKKIGLFANHTSLVGQTHLADTLLSLGIQISTAFSPEHGFLGNKPDGEKIEGEYTERFKLISLYGAHRKPTPEQVASLDLLVVDIQDVGARFYTYASTMTYLMEACAREKVPVLILDRPNPNGSYIDGPVLDTAFASFVGAHPIPIVHGLTLGELASMINGEGWLGHGLQCDLSVIPVANWDHSMPYTLPVRPSPNLPNELAVALYPSLALFEGTVVSVGRGTDFPFQIIGHPLYSDSSFSFTPTPNEGSKYPPLEGERCFGLDLTHQPINYGFTLKYLIQFYQDLKGKTENSFFNDYFLKLAGTGSLQEQIEAGWSEQKIKASWEKDLEAYRKLRKNYLLYAE